MNKSNANVEIGEIYWIPYQRQVFGLNTTSEHKSVFFPVRGKLVSYDMTMSEKNLSYISNYRLDTQMSKRSLDSKIIFDSLDVCQSHCEGKNILQGWGKF